MIHWGPQILNTFAASGASRWQIQASWSWGGEKNQALITPQRWGPKTFLALQAYVFLSVEGWGRAPCRVIPLEPLSLIASGQMLVGEKSSWNSFFSKPTLKQSSMGIHTNLQHVQENKICHPKTNKIGKKCYRLMIKCPVPKLKVVQKLIYTNTGLKVKCIRTYKCIRMFFYTIICFVRLFELKTEGKNNILQISPPKSFKKMKSKFFQIQGYYSFIFEFWTTLPSCLVQLFGK